MQGRTLTVSFFMSREAERLRERGNKPAYCYSRYYQAVAGGDACRD